MSESEPQAKEKIKLSDEFKKEIKTRKKRPWVSIVIVSVLGLVVFTSLGIGSYQIFIRPADIKQTNDANKIESRPASSTPKTTTVVPAVTSPPATKTPQTYTVQAGDTLSGIAAKYNTTSQVLASYNGIADPESILSIGQVIKIPN